MEEPIPTIATVACGKTLANLIGVDALLARQGTTRQALHGGKKVLWTKDGKVVAEAILSPETDDWRFYEA